MLAKYVSGDIKYIFTKFYRHNHRRFRNVLIANGPQYKINTVRVQPEDGDTCGLYCVHFVKYRYRNFTLEDIVNAIFWEMKCHPVCPFSIARVRVYDKALGSVLYSGGELVGATHGRRQFFKVAFQFVAVGETC
jgi:hypothetical protein